MKGLILYVTLFTSHVLLAQYNKNIPQPNLNTTFTGDVVYDIPMNYTLSGPVSAITVNPLNSQHIIVAAETGGLFETVNAGTSTRKWKFLPGITEHEITDVLITPAAGGHHVWMTMSNTFHNYKGPLIFRRETNGNWTKVFINGGSTTAAQAAYRVIYNPYTQKVYACGDFGIAEISKPSGTITAPDTNWNTRLTTIPRVRRYIAMEVLQNGTIVSMNDVGLHVLPAGSATWQLKVSGLTANQENHRFKLATDAGRQIILAVENMDASNKFRIHASSDNASSFSVIGGAEAPYNLSGAGGFPSTFCHFDPVQKSLTVYLSNRFEMYFASANGNNSAEALTSFIRNPRPPWTTKFTGLESGHPDFRHMVILNKGVSPEKMILTSDGGVHIADIDRTKTPTQYAWKTENMQSGLKTLQVTSVTGKESSIYFATWHDAFGASLDLGRTFVNGPAGEGIVLKKQGLPGNLDDRIFVTDGTGSQIRNSHVIFNIPGSTLNTPWNDPPNKFTSGSVPGPVFISRDTYIQQAGADGSSASGTTWYQTNNAGASWNPVLNSPLRRFGPNSGISLNPSNRNEFSVFVPVLNGSQLKIQRLRKPQTGPWVLTTIDLPNGLGALNLGNIFNGVFSSNPFDENQLLACDGSSGQLISSPNSGGTWTPVTSFNSFFNGTNKPNLRSTKGYFSITTISHSPFRNGIILVGTMSQGLFLSKNGGTSWIPLNNPGILLPTEVYWANENTAFVACYGRGLMKVGLRL
jgi:hypothetical protein